MTTNSSDKLFATMRAQVEEISRSAAETAKILALLQEAEEQSQRKEIKVTRKSQPLKKFMATWRNRFHYGVHWSKPLYPLRLARNILLGKTYRLFGLHKFVLRGVSFNATYKCNFRCNHCLCSQLEQSDSRPEMTPSDYQRVVKEAMDLGAMCFDNAGGEPFVSPIWQELIKACRAKYNYVFVSTNGFLFNEERAKRCKELGVSTIYFSLDSGYPELHDLFRRQRGSFERVMAGIELCKKYGLKTIINVVVHKGNLYTDHFREVLELGERKKILINTKFAKSVGNFKDKDSMLDEQDIEAFNQLMVPYNYAQRHLANNYGKQWGCPGTKENVIITPYGDVLNCAEMHVYLGNVLEEPLKDIRDRALKETPFGHYNACFLTEDKAFMSVYYKKMENAKQISIQELKEGLKQYQEQHKSSYTPSSS